MEGDVRRCAVPVVDLMHSLAAVGQGGRVLPVDQVLAVLEAEGVLRRTGGARSAAWRIEYDSMRLASLARATAQGTSSAPPASFLHCRWDDVEEQLALLLAETGHAPLPSAQAPMHDAVRRGRAHGLASRRTPPPVDAFPLPEQSRKRQREDMLVDSAMMPESPSAPERKRGVGTLHLQQGQQRQEQHHPFPPPPQL